MAKKILVLSGGGVKGCIQIQVLKKLEEELGPLHEHYDLICGSSVGAINAGIIASGKVTMKHLVDIYPDMLERTFEKRGIRIPRYDRKKFIKIWADLVGMMKMKESKTKLQITSLNLCDKRNHFFKSWTKDGEQYLVSEIVKSFAAPFYFGTLKDAKNKCVWMDGGMGIANIPILYALVESDMLWPTEDKVDYDIIGCGFVNNDIPYRKAKRYRVFRQLGQYFNLDDGGLAREQVRQEQIGMITQLAKVNAALDFRYWDIQIPKKMDGLDKIKYIPYYYDYGKEMAKKPLLIS